MRPINRSYEIARETGRILLSFDRDRGDLIYSQAVRPPHAVVYLRLEPPLPPVLNALLAAVVAKGETLLQGQFTVVTLQGMRQRALPAS